MFMKVRILITFRGVVYNLGNCRMEFYRMLECSITWELCINMWKTKFWSAHLRLMCFLNLIVCCLSIKMYYISFLLLF